MFVSFRGYLEDGFNFKEVASLLSVSESTAYRRMGRYGLSQLQFTQITEGEFDEVLEEITKEYPSCGEGLLKHN